MSAELVEWILRLAPPVSGDSRKEIIDVARRHRWTMQDFCCVVVDSDLQQPLLAVLRPVEMAAVCRAWFADFGRVGLDSDQQVERAEKHQRRSPSPRAFSPPARRPFSPERHQGVQEGEAVSPLHSSYVSERQRRERPRSSPPPRVQPRHMRHQPLYDEAPPPRSPRISMFQQELQGDYRIQSLRDFRLAPAFAVATSRDGRSAYVVGCAGLARFDLPSMELVGHCQYLGRAVSEGYAEVAVGDNFVVCCDLDGTLSEHDPRTCDLRCIRLYQPSVVEQSQRLVGSHIHRQVGSMIGLEGGFGGASRLTSVGRSIYLGGRDGVVTAYAAATLNVMTRCRLGDGAQNFGVRAITAAARSRKLYASVLSTVHVLTIPSLQPIAKLRGGPRTPIFGCITSVAETEDGSLVFAGDSGGPSIHIWETTSWRWLSRVELPTSGGPASHLISLPGDWVFCAATENGRFMAFGLDNLPPTCIEEGSGGGPLGKLLECNDYIVVLAHRGGELVLRPILHMHG